MSIWTKENINSASGMRIKGYIRNQGRAEGSRSFQWPTSLEGLGVLGLGSGAALAYSTIDRIGRMPSMAEGIYRWLSDRRGRITLAAIGLAVLLIPPVALEVAGRLTYTPMTDSERAHLEVLNAQLDRDYAIRYNQIMANLGVNLDAQSTPTITRLPITCGQTP